jgi:U3 small nucleolar RNA-associated protein 10
VSDALTCKVKLPAKCAIETIFASNEHTKRFESLLLKLSDPDPHARNLAYLVTRALCGRVTGENQIDTAQRVLDALALTTLEGMDGFLKGADTLHEVSHTYMSQLCEGLSFHYPVLE